MVANKGKRTPPGNTGRIGRRANGQFSHRHEVGKATRFKPGQSGNPSGRPPKSILDRALEAYLASYIKTGKRGPDGKRERKLVAEIVAEKLIGQAMAGEHAIAQLVAERVGGRPLHQVEAKIDATSTNPEFRKARINELLRKARS
jgi:hypothetical protein